MLTFLINVTSSNIASATDEIDYKTSTKFKNNPEREKRWNDIIMELEASNCDGAIRLIQKRKTDIVYHFWMTELLNTGVCMKKDRELALKITRHASVQGNFLDQFRYAYLLDNENNTSTNNDEIIETYLLAFALMLPIGNSKSKTKFLKDNHSFLFSGNTPSTNFNIAAEQFQTLLNEKANGYIKIANTLLSKDHHQYKRLAALKWLAKADRYGDKQANFLFIEAALQIKIQDHVAAFLIPEAIKKLKQINDDQLTPEQLEKIQTWRSIHAQSTN